MNNISIKKTIARLIAVQALYSQDVGNNTNDINSLTDELVNLATENSSSPFKEQDLKSKVDKKFFNIVIDQTTQNKEQIDSTITEFLDKNWNLEKLGPLMRAILRAAVFELSYELKTPVNVIISEYVKITNVFFDDEDAGEIGFVNAILENIGKKIRSK